MKLHQVVAWGSLAVAATLVGCYKPATTPIAGPPPSGGSAGPQQVAMASPTPTAAAPSSTGTATTAATKPAASDTKSAIAASPSGTLPKAAPTGDRYVRPAREMPIQPAPAPTRSSRNPVRKTAGNAPPPRTRVLDAPEAAAGVLPITFDNLMFPMERDDPFKPELLTDAVRSLFDKKVKIRGFIHPSCPQQTGVTSFILVRDDQGCCFGPGALLYDCIIVDMVPGRSTNFSIRPVAVQGILKFREYRDLNGRHEAIFHLDAESVE